MNFIELKSEKFIDKGYKYLNIEFKSSNEPKDSFILSFLFGLYEIKIRKLLNQDYAVNTIEKLEDFINEPNADGLSAEIVNSFDAFKKFHKLLDLNQKTYEILILRLKEYICKSEKNYPMKILPYLKYKIENLFDKSGKKEQTDKIGFLCNYFSVSCWIISDNDPEAKVICSDSCDNTYQPILYLHEWEDKSIGLISYRRLIYFKEKKRNSIEDLLLFSFQIDPKDQSLFKERFPNINFEIITKKSTNKKSAKFPGSLTPSIEETKQSSINNKNTEIPFKNSEIDENLIIISIEKAKNKGIPTPLDKKSWDNYKTVTNEGNHCPQNIEYNRKNEEILNKTEDSTKDLQTNSKSPVNVEVSSSLMYSDLESNNGNGEKKSNVSFSPNKIKINKHFKSKTISKQSENLNLYTKTNKILDKKFQTSPTKNEESAKSSSRYNTKRKPSHSKRSSIIEPNLILDKQGQKALKALIKCYKLTSQSARQKILNKLGLSEESMSSILSQMQKLCIFCSAPLTPEDLSSFSCNSKCKVCIRCREKGCPNNCPKCVRPYSNSELSIISR